MTGASVAIDQDLCVASGHCIRRVPALFVEAPDGIAALRSGDQQTAGPIAVPSEHHDAVDRAAFECPASAIIVTNDR